MDSPAAARDVKRLWAEFQRLQDEVEILANERDAMAVAIRKRDREQAEEESVVRNMQSIVDSLLRENEVLARELAEFDIAACYDNPEVSSSEDAMGSWPDRHVFKCMDDAFRPGVLVLTPTRVEYRPVLPRPGVGRVRVALSSVSDARLGTAPRGAGLSHRMLPLELRIVGRDPLVLRGFDNPALVCEVTSHYRRCSAAEGLADDTPTPAATAAVTHGTGADGASAGQGWRASAQHLRNRVWDVASGVTTVLHERVGTLVGRAGEEEEEGEGKRAPSPAPASDKPAEEPPSEGAPAPGGEDPVGAPTSDPQSEEGAGEPATAAESSPEAGEGEMQEAEADQGLSELHRFLATDADDDEAAEDSVEARLGVPSAYLRAARGRRDSESEGARLVLTPEGGGGDAEEKERTDEDLRKLGQKGPTQSPQPESEPAAAAAPAPPMARGDSASGGAQPESPEGGSGDAAWI